MGREKYFYYNEEILTNKTTLYICKILSLQEWKISLTYHNICLENNLQIEINLNKNSVWTMCKGFPSTNKLKKLW